MKIINKSKNTIYIDDIDFSLLYKDEEPEDIPIELLQKSRGLRGIILGDAIEVVSFDEQNRIENSIVYLKNKNKKEAPNIVQETDDVSYNELETVSEAIDVKIHGIFLDASGYGKVNRNLALGLSKAGFRVKVDPKRSQNQLNEEELRPIMALTKTPITKKHILIDSVIPSLGEMSSGRYKILYTTIESYTVPKQFIECCQQYEEIWVTCPFSADILRPLIDKPVYVVTTGVDLDLYKERGPKFDLNPNIKNFVFLSVFGWNKRKGYDVLLKAYLDEFSENDDVSLLIMSRYQSGHSRFHKNKIRDDIAAIMKEFPGKNLPHIVRCNKIIKEQDMPKLYRAGNCFVLPSRGESPCLPPLEASMCGLPVIMTNCSGQKLYLRPDNSYMIEIDYLTEIPPKFFNIHYWDGQKFPSLTSKSVHEQLCKTMREVYDNYDEAKKRNKNMQKLIREQLTWKHTANLAGQRLKEIHRGLK